jgi:hypothetical protein
MNHYPTFHPYDLIHQPELATLDLLASVARIARATLAARVTGLCFSDACDLHHHEPRKLIGHLLIDRCREIAEIVDAYQRAPARAWHDDSSDSQESDFPF